FAERGGAAVRAFAEGGAPVILTGSRGWDPAWSREVPLLFDAPVPTLAERHRIWSSALGDGSSPAGLSAPVGDLDSAAATAQFLLAPEQVVRAARAARQRAAAEGRPVGAPDLQAGARSQNAAGLERLARRIEPKVG